ncbi:hypothetical protein GCM10011521_12050 [Arenimonas soli]|uniref:Uncharacterized protein n=1 Tax=Arenimonas soli TaxID=2269504 RepID=A0ABQ1HHE3_9GAMM|nr:hypothetical protein [Arenimonas soli]GGA75483.1 hypothetical protein GCM10011521_12050 [Arenimonas soli]
MNKEEALPSVFGFVAGRHCTVFGSAPGRLPPTGYARNTIVCVNGSGLGLERHADITVMGAQICRAATRTCRHTLRNLGGRYSERMLWVHPGEMKDFEDRYRDFGFDWRESEVLRSERRRVLVRQLTGYELPGLTGPSAPSNGALAALLTATSGASRIDLCGFSLTSGHFYIADDTVRNHVDHDEYIFDWLSRHAPVHATDAAMRDRFGFQAP